MKVLIDAPLPKRLADLLSEMNIDAWHTLELPKGNTTTDKEIINDRLGVRSSFLTYKLCTLLFEKKV